MMPNVIAGALITSTDQIADDIIVNADINSAAAIAFSKLAALTDANILIGNGSNVAVVNAVTGDITISNSGVTTIGAAKVTEAMQVLADNTTNDVSTSAHGYVPKVPNNTTTFLRGDASFAVPVAGGIEFIKAEEITLTSNSESELATNTFSASDLDNADFLICLITSEDSAASNSINIKMKFDDSTNTLTSASLNSGEGGAIFFQMANGTSTGQISGFEYNGSVSSLATEGTMDSNFISAGWTWSMRGNLQNASPNQKLRYILYRVKSS